MTRSPRARSDPRAVSKPRYPQLAFGRALVGRARLAGSAGVGSGWAVVTGAVAGAGERCRRAACGASGCRCWARGPTAAASWAAARRGGRAAGAPAVAETWALAWAGAPGAADVAVRRSPDARPCLRTPWSRRWVAARWCRDAYLLVRAVGGGGCGGPGGYAAVRLIAPGALGGGDVKLAGSPAPSPPVPPDPSRSSFVHTGGCNTTSHAAASIAGPWGTSA